jgi:hypothetical protein
VKPNELTEFCPYVLVADESRQLKKYMWLSLFLLVLFYFIQDASLEGLVGALMITISAMLPTFLWLNRKVIGLPIMPLHAFTYIICFAIPLIDKHPITASYSLNDQLQASITVSIFLLLMTFIWYLTSSFGISAPKKFKCLTHGISIKFFFCILIAAEIYQVLILSGDIYWLPYNIVTILRAGLLGLNLVGSFYLPYCIGKNLVSPKQRVLFILIFFIFLLTNALSLLLVQSIFSLAMAVIGYTLGSKRIPWKTILIGLLLFTVLHAGKVGMREKYWFTSSGYLIQPTQYIELTSEWLGFAFDRFSGKKKDELSFSDQSKDTSTTSLFKRSSLMHIFLLVQSKFEGSHPQLEGRTYSSIILQAIPSIIYPDKPSSLEGTRLLNVHFGLQTEEGSLNATIGWGLFNESYANFGVSGTLLLAIFLGFTIGLVTRWSALTPVIASRTLFAIAVMAVSIQSEWTMGVLLVSLFQLTVFLVLITYLMMNSYKISDASEYNQF